MSQIHAQIEICGIRRSAGGRDGQVVAKLFGITGDWMSRC